MYLGSYVLKGVEFHFAFDGKTLSLFPKDETNRVAALGLTQGRLAEGILSFPGKPLAVDSPLELTLINSRKRLVLFSANDCFMADSLFNSNLTLDVISYFLIDGEAGISGLSIRSEVLNYAYDIQEAIAYSKFDDDGNLELSSSGRNGSSFQFTFENVLIEGYLTHITGVCYEKGKLPLRLRSQLTLSFQSTYDYLFLEKLVRIMHGYLAFLAQGHGYKYDDISLLKESELQGKKYLSEYGEYFEEGRRRDCEGLKSTIPLESTDAILSQLLFQALAQDKLILDHLPAVDERNSYDTGRIILILAALDKSLELIYKNGITHSEKAIASRRSINQALDAICEDGATNRLKNDVKWLKRILNESESLQARLSQFGKDHRDLFNKLNGRVFKNPQKRTAYFGKVSKTRNKIAHGDFDIFASFDFEDIEGTNQLLLSVQLVLVGLKDDVAIARLVNSVY